MVVRRNQIGHKQLFQFFLDRKDFRIILWPVPRELGMPLRELRQEFFHLVKTQHMVQLQDCTFFFIVMIQMILVLCQVNQNFMVFGKIHILQYMKMYVLLHEPLMLLSILIAKMSSLNKCNKYKKKTCVESIK